jgi:hypothetical protein
VYPIVIAEPSSDNYNIRSEINKACEKVRTCSPDTRSSLPLLPSPSSLPLSFSPLPSFHSSLPLALLPSNLIDIISLSYINRTTRYERCVSTTLFHHTSSPSLLSPFLSSPLSLELTHAFCLFGLFHFCFSFLSSVVFSLISISWLCLTPLFFTPLHTLFFWLLLFFSLLSFSFFITM